MIGVTSCKSGLLNTRRNRAPSFGDPILNVEKGSLEFWKSSFRTRPGEEAHLLPGSRRTKYGFAQAVMQQCLAILLKLHCQIDVRDCDTKVPGEWPLPDTSLVRHRSMLLSPISINAMLSSETRQ